jgi:predicted metal-dependent phosphotriesterase family hydrolase
LCQKVAKGAGLDDDEVHALLQENPRELLAKLGLDSLVPA